MYFAFKRTSGQLNSKDFRCVMTRATRKQQATGTTSWKRNFLNIFWKFYQRNLRLSFMDWEPNWGDNINHTLLSSATGLESPKSLASDRESFWDSFSSIGCGFHLFCLQVHDLRFALQCKFSFRFLNLLFLVCWMKTSSLHWWKVKRWKKIGNCCCLVLFFFKFIELACTQMYLSK